MKNIKIEKMNLILLISIFLNNNHQILSSHHFGLQEYDTADSEKFNILGYSEITNDRIGNFKSVQPNLVLTKTLSFLNKPKNSFHIFANQLNDTVFENSKSILESILFKDSSKQIKNKKLHHADKKFNESNFLEFVMNNIIDSTKSTVANSNDDVKNDTRLALNDSIEFLRLFKKLFIKYKTMKKLVSQKANYHIHSKKIIRDLISYLKNLLNKNIYVDNSDNAGGNLKSEQLELSPELELSFNATYDDNYRENSEISMNYSNSSTN